LLLKSIQLCTSVFSGVTANTSLATNHQIDSVQALEWRVSWGWHLDVDPIFKSFFQAGFECSTHINNCGKRLDLVSTTKHDQLVLNDFRSLRSFGITTVREGARWHLIEATPGTYDFSSLAPILDASRMVEVEIILDLFHFGWPDHIDIFSASFIESFGRYGEALTKYLIGRGTPTPFLAPVNEISFLAWAGGDKGFVNPHATGRGHELKRQLVGAAIRASEVILQELPGARLVAPEPVIHIVGDPAVEGSEEEAREYSSAQFEAWDMLSGRVAPHLGGKPEYLDILGLNFYDRNEWVHNAEVSLRPGDPRYKPFHQILAQVWQRYRRPLFVAEAGAEDDARVPWFNYICDETLIAIDSGVPVHGICLYPIVNHPGWEDDRYCRNGLFDYANDSGDREVYAPLAEAIRSRHDSGKFRNYQRRSEYGHNHQESHLLLSSTMDFRIPTTPAFDEQIRSSQPSSFFRGASL
jgi:hypothetical protein